MSNLYVNDIYILNRQLKVAFFFASIPSHTHTHFQFMFDREPYTIELQAVIGLKSVV